MRTAAASTPRESQAPTSVRKRLGPFGGDWYWAAVTSHGIVLEADPSSDLWTDFYSGSIVIFTVPLDNLAETHARRWFAEGRRGMRSRFWSISGMTGTATPPPVSPRRFVGIGCLWAQTYWSFPSRELAHETLVGWGYDVGRTILKGPDDYYRGAAWALRSVCIVLTMTALQAAFGRAGPTAGARTLTMVILAVAAVLASAGWILRKSEAFEFSFSSAGARHWIASYDGRLLWITVDAWPDDPLRRPPRSREQAASQTPCGGPLVCKSTRSRSSPGFEITPGQPMGPGWLDLCCRTGSLAVRCGP